MDKTETETNISDMNGNGVVHHDLKNENYVSSKYRSVLNSEDSKREIQTVVYNTIYFLTKLITCICIWMLLILCVVIPVGPFAMIYYTLKLIEEYIYQKFYNGEGLTSVDALWMQDGPKNRTIINALFIAKVQLDGEIAHEKIREVFQRKFIQATDKDGKRLYSRATKYVHAGIFNYFWIEEKHFKLEDHIYLSDVEAGSKDELRQMLSELCSRPLNLKPGMSPWEYIVIPWNCGNDVRKMAVMYRGHHCMADGVSLSRFLAYQLPDNEAKGLQFRKLSGRGRLFLFAKGLFWLPIFLVKILFTWSDQSILHGQELNGTKKVTWSEPVDLNLVKRIKNATKTTVNDVLVSCLAGTLVKYFQTKGAKLPQYVNVSLPVDLRKNMDEDAADFANKFAILQFHLPTGLCEPLKMLYETKRRMDFVKMSGEPFAVNTLMALSLAVLPEVITKPFFQFIGEKTTGVLSNVPGPQNSITVAGHELEVMTFWPPQKDNIGMSFSICSYANKVFLGVECDEAILQDPEEICGEFEGQFENLRNHCNLLKID